MNKCRDNVLREALNVYIAQQQRLASDARNMRKMRELFATRSDRIAYARERESNIAEARVMLAEAITNAKSRSR